MEMQAPAAVCLSTDLPEREPALLELARRFDLPLCAAAPGSGWSLVLTAERLELRPRGGSRQGPVYVDFVGGALGHRRRFGGGRGQPLARAAGMKQGHNPFILDATAGLGRDAFVLASLGGRVVLCERAPVLAALLEDGLQRAAANEETGEIAKRMALVHSDAVDYLESLPADACPEVIYLDPMYPAGKDAVLVKKEMRALQQLLGPDRDSRLLLECALATATRRVVVKRPKRAPWLHGRAPSTSIESKKTRYDIYIRHSANPS